MSLLNSQMILLIYIAISIISTRVYSYSLCTNNTDLNDIECDYCLSQIDFKYGTYRIINSGIYCLTEDIIFNPLSPSPSTFTPNTIDPLSWFPTDNEKYPGCTTMRDGPFALGFFSVIDIEISNVIIDLNGYKIAYHFQFYLEQRFGSIIEISNQPFLPSNDLLHTDFGDNFIEVSNIIIRNGELGLSSHHGIHSNNATNITISDMKIYDFEVAGIHLNGFHHAIIDNVDIGPSLQNAPLTAYYSNARYLVLAMRQLLEGIDEQGLAMPNISFSYLSVGILHDDKRTLTLKQVNDNLVKAMDIIFRYNTAGTKSGDEALYKSAMKLFNNDHHLPDGSAMYGIVLNSYDVAVEDFGDAPNGGIRQGSDVIMNNIILHDMSLQTKEVIGVNFIECHEQNRKLVPKVTRAPIGQPVPTPSPEYQYWHEWYLDYYDYHYMGEDDDTDGNRRRLVSNLNEYDGVSTGPFGDVMDITEMIPIEQIELITKYDGTKDDLSVLDYIGNPLSDAQIALYLYGDYLDDGRNYAYTSFISPYLLGWAVKGMKFPSFCVDMIRNRDNMHQINKGIVGIRMDGIEGAQINNISINNLYNKASVAPTDDKNIRGISVIDGELLIMGTNTISNLDSWYGLSTGLDIMDGTSYIDYEQGATLDVSNLLSMSKITSSQDDSINAYVILVLVGLALLICVVCFCMYYFKSKETKNVGRPTKHSLDGIMAHSGETVRDSSANHCRYKSSQIGFEGGSMR